MTARPVGLGQRSPRLYPIPPAIRITHPALMEATAMNRVSAHAALRGELLLTLNEADRLAVALCTHIDTLWPELAEATPHLCEICGLEPVRRSTRYCSIGHQKLAANRRKYAAKRAALSANWRKIGTETP